VIDHFNPSPTWKYLFQVGADGYTTNAPRSEFDRENIFISWELDDKPLPVDHGIIRIINATLYGYKSSKFLSEIHFLEEEEKGYWEQRGIHERGKVMNEERFNEKKREITGIQEANRIIKVCQSDCSTQLDLSGLELDEIPDAVFELTNLRTLLLYNNQITTIPDKAKSLKKLRILSLNSNKFRELPPVIGELSNLQELWICKNLLTELPEEILRLNKLFVIGFEHNKITHLPKGISNMKNLGAIFGDYNQITELPVELADRQWTALLFSENPITFVPTELHKLKDIEFFSIFGSPCIPPHVLEDGTSGLLAYLETEHLKKLQNA